MAGKRTPAAEGSVVEEPGVGALFTAGERWEMEQRAKVWEENVDELLTWLQNRVLFLIQIVEKLATGEKSLPGRTGQNIFYRALKEFHELATLVMKAKAGAESKK